MLVNRDFKRLGDLAAGTVVVYREGRSRARSIPAAAPLAPPPRSRSASSARCSTSPSARRRLTPERVEELAELPRPSDRRRARGDRATERMLGMANHLGARAVRQAPFEAAPRPRMGCVRGVAEAPLRRGARADAAHRRPALRRCRRSAALPPPVPAPRARRRPPVQRRPRRPPEPARAARPPRALRRDAAARPQHDLDFMLRGFPAPVRAGVAASCSPRRCSSSGRSSRMIAALQATRTSRTTCSRRGRSRSSTRCTTRRTGASGMREAGHQLGDVRLLHLEQRAHRLPDLRRRPRSSASARVSSSRRTA